eukprot:CAMPEP_0183830510 /NCGR_PEP_ID=MMETSP0807_2-20130328/4061_1 /TAXON_ID=88271 /ORGANISM="Picocystis salinarum, Strain CCMP1897" /LENGTH=53 /DNA_ID=CAMNT_0026075881 /DNA_START=935 /DNA_END=1096 /DNA_ORIENTATION=+
MESPLPLLDPTFSMQLARRIAGKLRQCHVLHLSNMHGGLFVKDDDRPSASPAG